MSKLWNCREKSGLSDILKSKHEENEAYISELETIGQACDDMQAQNQQLLQQITERDNYNIKVIICTTIAHCLFKFPNRFYLLSHSMHLRPP
ncbi:hypothetical protein ACSBR1_037880 [Camellia fascicularis]